MKDEELKEMINEIDKMKDQLNNAILTMEVLQDINENLFYMRARLGSELGRDKVKV